MVNEISEISEIVREHEKERTNYLTNIEKETNITTIKKPEEKEYQKIYTLKKAIEKKYLPSNASIQEINEELIEKLIQGGDFCIYNKDGSVDMYFDAPKYETKTKIKTKH